MLPEYIQQGRSLPPQSSGEGDGARDRLKRRDDHPEMIRPFWQVERDEIQRALDLCKGNVQEVARRMEISPATLYRKIEKFGLVK
jgi:transcriptional regulator of acetoin/glycerol metabolism